MNFFLGLIGVVAGFFYIKYSKKIADSLGMINFAEKYLGSGGTYTLHKIIGIVIIAFSFMWMTGTLQALIFGIFGPITGAAPAI